MRKAGVPQREYRKVSDSERTVHLVSDSERTVHREKSVTRYDVQRYSLVRATQKEGSLPTDLDTAVCQAGDSRFVQTCDLRRETPGTGPWRERPVTDQTQVTCVTPAVPKRQVSIAVQVSIARTTSSHGERF